MSKKIGDAVRRGFGALRLAPSLLAIALFSGGEARGQLRIATYNTLDKPTNSTADSQLATIFGAIGTTPVNGIAKRVDVIALQEQTNVTGNNTAARIAGVLNNLYGVNSYTWGVEGTGIDKLAFVYDTSTVMQLSLADFPVGTRPGLWLQVRPVGYTSDDAVLNMYSVHLKAGSTSSEKNTRESEAVRIRNHATFLGSDPNIIYMGDFNIGSSTDSSDAHDELIAPGVAQPIDPVNQPVWPNSTPAVSKILTQSTRTANIGDGGATSGVDDRFDLQYVTSPLLDGEGLSYIGPTSTGMNGLDHSYRAFGNDGTSWDQAITSPASGRSQPASVLQALHNFSDHLPVVADYQLPAILNAMTASVPSTLLIDEVFNLQVTVSNVDATLNPAVPVDFVLGADELDYDLTTSGDVSGQFLNQMDAALGGMNTHFVTLDTSTPGIKNGLITITSNSQGVENGLVEIPISYEVIGDTLTGDYNDDGVVDAADYVLWRSDPSEYGGPGGYSDWVNNFGTMAGSGGGPSAAVPEPGSWLLVCVGGCLAAMRRGRLKG